MIELNEFFTNDDSDIGESPGKIPSLVEAVHQPPKNATVASRPKYKS